MTTEPIDSTFASTIPAASHVVTTLVIPVMNPTDSAAIALRGASLAFQNKEKLDEVSSLQKKNQQSPNTSSRHNGAHTAATQAGRSTTTTSPARSARGPQSMEGSTLDVVDPRQTKQQGLVAARAFHHQKVGAAAATPTPSSHVGLATAAGAGKIDAKSPSRIAAELAASRSGSPISAARTVRKKGSVGGTSPAGSSRASSSASEAAAVVVVVDSGSIAPTGSLISIFERARGGGGTAERAAPLRPSPPESTGSCPEERLGGPGRSGKAALGKSKPGPDPRPPTPPLQPRPAVTPSKPPTAGLSRPRPAAASPNPPRPISAAAMPPSTPKAPTSQSRQSNPPHITSPPRLPASTRRPITPTPISSSPHPSTPAPSSAKKKKPPQSPLPQGISRSNTVTTTPKNGSTGPPPSTPRAQTPPPVMGSRPTAEVLSPQPKRVPKTPLSSMKSPHLTLNPSVQTISSPSPDPQKRSSTAKRPPTPPKPRRGAAHSHHQDLPSSRAMDPSIGEALRSGGKSISPAPSRQSHPSPSLHAWRQSILTAPPSPTREGSRRRPTNISATNLHLESLADAIVAGSLASARLTPHSTGSTLALPPPSLPQRQRSPRLLQTLRQPVSLSDEESDRHKKGYHRPRLHKGKHAHHEGSRKKWREEIRPRERKRYDALWASNRGLLLIPLTASPSASVVGGSSSSSSVIDRDGVSQYVANIVVREIWRRSRLPVDELAEIWDLVDREGMGMLSRQEFVVGTWLVDQRLKGRKVPAKVTDSVWGSANGVTARKLKRR